MKQINYKSNIALIVFIIGILLSILTLLIPKTNILYLGPLVISLLYLVMGWYLFKDYYPEGHTLLLFLFGYLYSGVFIAATFYGADWPLAKIFVNISPVWSVILFSLIFIFRKKMPKKGLIQFIIEAGILLLFSILLIIMLK